LCQLSPERLKFLIIPNSVTISNKPFILFQTDPFGYQRCVWLFPTQIVIKEQYICNCTSLWKLTIGTRMHIDTKLVTEHYMFSLYIIIYITCIHHA
jgi:hypothetical protein